MGCRSYVALCIAVTTPAYADTIEVSAGIGAMYFATPNESRDDAAGALTVSLAGGTEIRPDLRVALRGRLAIGDGHIAALAPQVEHRSRSFVVAYGPAVVRVLGSDVALERPRGLGLGLALDAGVVIGRFVIATHALPTWVFASDAPAFDATLDGALEVGVTVGFRH